jgi:predicted transcriptional regulator
MKPHCEAVASKLLPTLRALIAKELIENYNMTQQQVAKKLGTTQSAISQYTRQLRGSKTEVIEKDKVVSNEIEIFANKLVSDEVKNPSEVLECFCNICKTVRMRKLI